MIGLAFGLILMAFFLLQASRYLWQHDLNKIPQTQTLLPGGLIYRRGTILPLYFLRYADGSFEVADPQPSIFAPAAPPEAHEPDKTKEAQLKFLLEQAPMLDMLTADRCSAARTPYAYVHPMTFAKVERWARKTQTSQFMFIGSPTRWTVTSLIPRDRVIFSPNLMPGLPQSYAMGGVNAR